jgi:hypothetical protein
MARKGASGVRTLMRVHKIQTNRTVVSYVEAEGCVSGDELPQLGARLLHNRCSLLTSEAGLSISVRFVPRPGCCAACSFSTRGVYRIIYRIIDRTVFRVAFCVPFCNSCLAIRGFCLLSTLTFLFCSRCTGSLMRMLASLLKATSILFSVLLVCYTSLFFCFDHISQCLPV